MEKMCNDKVLLNLFRLFKMLNEPESPDDIDK